MDALSSFYENRLLIPVLILLAIVGVGVVLFATGYLHTDSTGNEPPLLDVANAAGVVVAVDGIHTYAYKEIQRNVVFKVEVQGFKIGDKVCIQTHADGTRHIHPLRFCQ